MDRVDRVETMENAVFRRNARKDEHGRNGGKNGKGEKG